MRLSLVKPTLNSLELDKVNFMERFEISPLEENQAYIFGNSLRITLLSHIPGYAITNFKLGSKKSGEKDYVYKTHIFDVASGIVPDVADISLRFKKIACRLNKLKEKEITLVKKGPCVVTAGDLECEDVKILNPSLEIFKIVDDTEVSLTIRVREGRGYKDESCFDEVGWISLDGNFSPVQNVKTSVNGCSINGVSGFEKLELEITTNGKLFPKEALDIAIKILHESYDVLDNGVGDLLDNEPIYFDVEEDETSTVTYKKLEELGLSARAFNALKADGINNTGDLEKRTEKQIKEIDNLGKKTFEEVKKKVAELGLEFKRA